MVAIAYASEFEINSEAEKEVARRFSSRRSGSNFPAEEAELVPASADKDVALEPDPEDEEQFKGEEDYFTSSFQGRW